MLSSGLLQLGDWLQLGPVLVSAAARRDRRVDRNADGSTDVDTFADSATVISTSVASTNAYTK